MPVLSIDGQTINYVQEGAGPAVVLIHGLGASLHMWREQINALKSGYTVIAFDLRGHGQSSGSGELSVAGSARDLAALLSHIGVTHCHLVGISMGARVALTFNAEHPNVARGLVLADASVRVSEGAAEHVKATREAIAYISMQEFGTQYAAQNLMFSTAFSIQDELAETISKMHPKAYMASMTSAELSDISELLSAVRLPTLVLVGESDTATPKEEAEFIAGHISGSVLEVIPEAGHLSSLDNPAAFNAALVKFLQA